MKEHEELFAYYFNKEETKEEDKHHLEQNSAEHSIESWHNLDQFINWVFSPSGPGLKAHIPLLSQPRFEEGVCSVFLGRWKAFQIEQIICQRDFRALYHSKKECERIAVVISGSVNVTLENGDLVTTSEHFDYYFKECEESGEKPSPDYGVSFYNSRLFLPSGENILFEVGEFGAVFLIFEKIEEGQQHESVLDDFEI